MESERLITIGRRNVEAGNSDEALALTLEQVLTSGHRVESTKAGKKDGFSEILGFQLSITDSRDRITRFSARPLNIVGAVARFVWMMAGSDRLEDIAFYEPKARGWTDNQISMPGSNYGMRLFQPRPGLNQIEGVIKRMNMDRASRRAAMVIWVPEDAVRDSSDIPCAFGTYYAIRGEQLVSTTIMRSNNAWLLLPYNTFEFTLFAEVVATSTGANLGPYIHFAASMHVIDGQRESAEKVVRAFRSSPKGQRRLPMPPMPTEPAPLSQVNELVRLEAALRHDHDALTTDSADVLLSRGTKELETYWIAFYRVLLTHALTKARRNNVAAQVANQLPPYFHMPVVQQATAAPKVGSPRPIASPSPLFPELAVEIDSASARLAPVAAAFALTVDEERRAQDELHAICRSLEAKQGKQVLRSEFEELQRRLITERPPPLAARSESGRTGSLSDRTKQTPDEVERLLAEIRRRTAG